MLRVRPSENFRELINPDNLNEAFRNYHSQLALSNQPLAFLATVSQREAQLANEKNAPTNLRGAALAAELKNLISALEPKDSGLPSSHSSRYPYEIFNQTVVQGRSATTVAARLFISRSQLYRIREKTINDLCQIWLENEEQLLGESPEQEITPEIIPITPPTAQPSQPTSPTYSASAGFRMVTVLQTRLAGFNKTSANLDPEEAHNLLTYLMGIINQVVLAHGGFVSHRLERGLWVLFGAPASHEDDFVRAVDCALALRVALSEAQATWGGQQVKEWSEIRTALTSGRVFVESNAPSEYNITGPCLELANALVERAPIGQILLDQATYKLVRGHFEIQAGQNLTLPEDIAEVPVAVYRVLGARIQSETTHARGVLGVETKMVGRNLEWSLLTRIFSECSDQNSVRQLTIVGPAGIGKSRLEYEFRQYIELDTRPAFYWRGHNYHPDHQPYQPFGRILSKLADFDKNDTVVEKREKLLQLCEQLFSGAGELTGLHRAEEIAQLLAVLLELGWENSPVLAILENRPTQAQLYTFQAFSALCAAFARTKPVVLVLEDLQWAEEATLALWSFLGGALENSPVLLIGLSRPELYEKKPEWAGGLDYHIRLDLKPLTPARTRELIQHLLRNMGEIPERLIEQLVLAAEGNPFYVEEITKTLLEEGYIVSENENNNWRLARPLPEILPTPPTVEGLLQARLDRLPATERAILERAAIVGRNFAPGLVASLLNTTGESETALKLEENLTRLQQRELIYQRPFAGNEPVFAFKHSLLREVIYVNLPKRQRLVLHLALAEWLEESYQRSEKAHRREISVALLAEQFEQAGLIERAASYYGLAAEEARAAFALKEAANYYEKAIADTNPTLAPVLYAKLLIGRAQLLFLHAEYDAAWAKLETALPLLNPLEPQWLRCKLLRAEIKERQGQYDQGIQECQAGLEVLSGDNPIAVALLKVQLGSLLFRKSRYDEAAIVLQEALAGLQSRTSETNNRELNAMASCYKYLGLVAWAQGRLKEAAADCQNSLLVYERLSDWSGQASCYDSLGLISREWGEIEQAEKYLRKAKDLFEKVGDRQRTSYNYANLGVLYWYKGELEKAEETIKTAQASYQQIGGQFGLAVCGNTLGQIYRDRGDYAGAAAWLRQSMEAILPLGDERSLAHCYFSLAKLAHSQGHYEEAAMLVQQSQELRDKIGHRAGQVDCNLLLGWLDFEREGDDGGGFERAYKLAETIEYGFGLAQANIGLGALELAEGNFQGALAHLNQAHQLAQSKKLRDPWIQATLWLGRHASLSGDGVGATSWLSQTLELAGSNYPNYANTARSWLTELKVTS